MDFPRSPSALRGGRVGVGVALAVLVLGYGPLKHAAIAALEIGARAGLRLTAGSPGLGPDPLRQSDIDGAAWLETASTPRKAGEASSHSGGLFRPEYTEDGDMRLPESYPVLTEE